MTQLLDAPTPLTGRMHAGVNRQITSLAAQSVILTGSRVFAFVVTFIIPIALVRLLDPSTFGLYKQMFLVAGTLVTILNLGLTASLFYFIPRDAGRGYRCIRNTAFLLAGLGAIVAAILTLAPGYVASILRMPTAAHVLPLVGLYVLVVLPSDIAFILPIIDKRPLLAGILVSGSSALQGLLVVLAALAFGTVAGVFSMVIALAVLRGLWLLIYLQQRKTTVAPGEHHGIGLADQLRYALPFAVASVFTAGLMSFHQYFVAARVSDAQYAIYALGILNIPLFGMMAQSVSEVMLVRATELYQAGHLAELRGLCRTAIERLAFGIVPLWMCLELVAPDLFLVLFGPEYQTAASIFRLFVAVCLLEMIVDHGVLRATGDTGFIVRANGVGFIVTVLFVLMLGRGSAFGGAVAGFGVGLAVTRGLGLWMVRRRLEAQLSELLPVTGIIRIAICSMAAVVVASTCLVFPHPAVRLIMCGTVFVATYLALAAKFRLLPPEAIWALRSASPRAYGVAERALAWCGYVPV